MSDQIRRNDMNAADRLDQIEARANAATEGPWSIPAWHDFSVMPSAWADDELPPEERGEFAHISTTSDTDADFIAHARTDVPWLIEQVRKRDAALQAVLDLHRPFTVWDECDCTPEQKDDETTHVEVDDVGRTCSRLYVVCEECCTYSGYQTEDCAAGHDHTLDPADRCPTVRAIEEALT